MPQASQDNGDAMSMTKLAALILMAGGLGACSRSPAPDPSQPRVAHASTAIPASNPFASMLKTRDRARAVQQSINAHDKAERKALQDAQH